MSDILGTPPRPGVSFIMQATLIMEVNADGTYSIMVDDVNPGGEAEVSDNAASMEWFADLQKQGGEWWEWMELALFKLLDFPHVVVDSVKPDNEHFKTAEDYRKEFLALLQQGNQ